MAPGSLLFLNVRFFSSEPLLFHEYHEYEVKKETSVLKSIFSFSYHTMFSYAVKVYRYDESIIQSSEKHHSKHTKVWTASNVLPKPEDETKELFIHNNPHIALVLRKGFGEKVFNDWSQIAGNT